MQGLAGALLTDVPTGCVLLGQRNVEQVEAAAHLGSALSKADADWVKDFIKSNRTKELDEFSGTRIKKNLFRAFLNKNLIFLEGWTVKKSRNNKIILVDTKALIQIGG